MDLNLYKHATSEVPVGKEMLTVRGLNLEDFGILISDNFEPISKAVELYVASTKDVFSTQNMTSFILVLVREFPKLAVEVISMAADQPDARPKLPIAVQMSALAEIGRLTIQDAGGLGNLFAVLQLALDGVLGGKLGESLKPILSRASIGASGKTLAS